MTILKIVGAIAAVALVSGAAAAYVAFGAFLPWREAAEADRLARAAGVRPGSVVADVGAGAGRFTVFMARRVGEDGTVFSTDVDPKRVRALHARAARERLRNVRVVQGAPAATNLPDACCDLVLLRNVYHHVGDPGRFAESLARAVKPGGTLVVIDFEPGALPLHGAPADGGGRRAGHGVSRADAVAELTPAGFVVREEVPGWGGPMWMVRLERVVTGRPAGAS